MVWLKCLILFFTFVNVLGGHSTGHNKPVRPIVYPSIHPKQRFIGHHEGSIGQEKVPDQPYPSGIGRPLNPWPEEKIVPVSAVLPCGGDTGTGKRPLQDKDVRDTPVLIREPPRGIIVEEKPKEVYIGDKEEPAVDPSVKVIQIEEIPGPIGEYPKDVQIDGQPGPIGEYPKDIQIGEQPGPIGEYPKDIQIGEQPGPIGEYPKDVQIGEQPGPIGEYPKDIQIEEQPGPILVDIPKITEENPVRIPSEIDQGQKEIPYPVKVNNENSNLNLYEMLQKLQLSRFVHLVEEAGLEDLLSGNDQITIFAPSDYALSKLKANEIRRLASDKELLRQFVLYHCVDGSLLGSSLPNDPIKTRIDKNVLVSNYHGERWYVNGIELKTKDQVCKNGAIHIIDAPLYPFPTGGILETLEASGNFKVFSELIRNAKLDELLKGEYRWTIFAPTDVAFSKLPAANVEWLKWDIPEIKRLFRQVACRGYYYTSWVNSGSSSPPISLENENLNFSGYPETTVNGMRISQRDITANNGCIQGIDDIWFGSSLAPSEPASVKKE